MDLFDVDTWASDKQVDELNTQLFGAVTDLSTRTQSKRKDSHRDINVTEKKEKKKRNNKDSSRNIKNGEESKVRKKRKNKENSATKKANQSSEIKKKVKKPKALKTASAKVEVIETHCEGNESTSFTDFLNAEPGDRRKGIGVLKKKRRSSSKNNKYKHLNEFRKALQEEANKINANESKIDIDLNAKLNSRVLVPQKTDKTQGIKNYEDGQVVSPSGKKNKSMKKKAKHPQKNTENVHKTDNEKESFRSENIDHSKIKIKHPQKNTENVHKIDHEKESFRSENTDHSKRKIKHPQKNTENVHRIDNKKESFRSENTDNNKKKIKPKKRKQDGSGVDDLVDPPKKKKSRTTENGNKEIIRSMPKQKNAKKSTLDVSHLKEAIKQQSPKMENERNTKTKEISKAKKNKNLSLRDRMLEQLNSSRFRYINEQLYTVPGHEVSTIGFFCKLALTGCFILFVYQIYNSSDFVYQTAELFKCYNS